MSDDLSQAVDDAHPSCPSCGARLELTDTESTRLFCPECGLDVLA